MTMIQPNQWIWLHNERKLLFRWFVFVVVIMVYFNPLIAELKHEHTHIECSAGTGSQFHEFHHSCQVCLYHINGSEIIALIIENSAEHDLNVSITLEQRAVYIGEIIDGLFLRAPPAIADLRF